jgi:predicted flavoprotein YhiN
MKTIAIIGGGAAGMMCAATLLDHIENPTEDFEIRLFEKNAVLGKKVSISGGGRCNVTTGIADRKILLGKYTRGAEFLKHSLGKF